MLKTLIERIASNICSEAPSTLLLANHSPEHSCGAAIRASIGVPADHKGVPNAKTRPSNVRYSLQWADLFQKKGAERRSIIKKINRDLRDFICVQLIQYAITCAQVCTDSRDNTDVMRLRRTPLRSTTEFRSAKRTRRRMGFSIHHVDEALHTLGACDNTLGIRAWDHAIVDCIPTIHVQQIMQYIFTLVKNLSNPSAREPSWRNMSSITRSQMIQFIRTFSEETYAKQMDPFVWDDASERKQIALLTESFRASDGTLLMGAKYFIASRVRDSLLRSFINIDAHRRDTKENSETIRELFIRITLSKSRAFHVVLYSK